MIRVANLDRSIEFYRDALGMSELRRETFPDARFTLVFMGYAAHPNGATVELTWNWDSDSYTHGSGYGHVALAVSDIYGACARLAEMGVEILREAGPMKAAPQETGEREEIAFIADPDGYRIELIGHSE
ncbi:lactoylglutathione lyase [Jannaschia faecimaris]|nr:lactoylglutathione lyase [Jannaschia faecimaris]